MSSAFHIQNVPVVTISWIFFFGLCFVVFLVLSLCSDSHCACCRCCIRNCRCCRELCTEEGSALHEKHLDKVERNRNISENSLQNTLVVSSSEGLSIGGNPCTSVNGNGILGGSNTQIPTTSVVPNQEFYC